MISMQSLPVMRGNYSKYVRLIVQGSKPKASKQPSVQNEKYATKTVSCIIWMRQIQLLNSLCVYLAMFRGLYGKQ